jgi:hypothetical protein
MSSAASLPCDIDPMYLYNLIPEITEFNGISLEPTGSFVDRR